MSTPKTRSRGKSRLVLHGKAAADSQVREGVQALRQRGHDLEVRVTWEPGQAEYFAGEAARAGYDRVIAGGGDGTVNGVVAGLLEAGSSSHTAVGILPLGTANDFATCCGIEVDAVAAALEFALTGLARPIDIGTVNDNPFVNLASAGFGAEVTTKTPDGMKSVLGGVAYSVVGLATALTMTPHRGRIITPEEEYETALVLLAVGNGRQAGGGFRLAPRALLNDGLLDLVVVPEFSVAESAAVLGELLNLAEQEPKRLYYRQLARFTIESEEPLQMNLDGEPMSERRYEVQVLPKRLRFVLPDAAPLADSGGAGASS